MFGLSRPKSIFISRIDYGRSENILLSIRITFKKTTKHKSLYLKINFNQINSNKINSIYNQFYKSKTKHTKREWG